MVFLRLFFFFFIVFPSLSVCLSLSVSFMEDQMKLSQASRDLKLIFSPLLLNAKITHDLKERIMYFSFHSFLKTKGKKDLCMPPLLPEEMQCMFSAEQGSQVTG